MAGKFINISYKICPFTHRNTCLEWGTLKSSSIYRCEEAYINDYIRLCKNLSALVIDGYSLSSVSQPWSSIKSCAIIETLVSHQKHCPLLYRLSPHTLAHPHRTKATICRVIFQSSNVSSFGFAILTFIRFLKFAPSGLRAPWNRNDLAWTPLLDVATLFSVAA